jgi:polar amino acid transport system substrate-binding protein
MPHICCVVRLRRQPPEVVHAHGYEDDWRGGEGIIDQYAKNPGDGCVRVLWITFVAGLLALCSGAAALGQASPRQLDASLPDRELVIATKEAAPFAMKGPDGTWQGISIELWRHVADQLHLRYHFVEVATVQDLLAATEAGKVDAAVAAVTVTAARAQTSDFSQPFYRSGLGVAVAGGVADWLPILRAFLSFRFLQAIVALLAIALIVGTLVWLFERRQNHHFAGKAMHGLASGIWWSAVAMTQAGAAQGAPSSLPGRLLAVVWMIVSIIALAVFTAGVTSAITTHQLQGLVRNVDDLRSLRVAVVNGSSSVDFLEQQRITHRGFTDPTAALNAVQQGSIDAFVYDRPLLSWIVRGNFPSLQVLGVSFDPQNYAIALPLNSALRVPIDVALLESVTSEWWQQVLYRYSGQASTEGR